MTITFDTAEYEVAYDRTPRGRGCWAFEVECVTPQQRACMLDPQFHGIVSVIPSPGGPVETVMILTRGSTTWGEAKAQVKHFLRVHFNNVCVRVCT